MGALLIFGGVWRKVFGAVLRGARYLWAMGISKKTQDNAAARAKAIELELLWVCKSLWLEGPLPRRALAPLVGRGRFERAERFGFIVGVETRAGKLFTVGPEGRRALGLDRSSSPLPGALELGFARRVVAAGLLNGAKPKRQSLAEGRLEQGRGVARLYVEESGLEVWLLVGLPDPSPATLSRLVNQRAQGAPAMVVAADPRRIAKWPLHSVIGFLWPDALLSVEPAVRSSLERLLKKRGSQ